MSDSPTPAAQYLRISRETQFYSIPEQIATIKKFAAANNFEIIRTYRDTASGLLIKNRSGLQQLLYDILKGLAQYRAVLINDVSRWGRFQDSDEAAHYEFLCKQAGVPVYYCAEAFANEHGIACSIGKALKRAMAAEYSRELSVKCFRAQKKLSILGFRMGATPGYGLRRMAISRDGKHRAMLAPGEYKALATDRVVLVPGPAREVACVRNIFQAVLKHRMCPHEIAQDLNRKRVPYRDGEPWPTFAVERILTNPKYVGDLVWNRTSFQLHKRRTQRPPDDWIVKKSAFAPLIDSSDFARAQLQLATMNSRWSDETLLSKLKQLLNQRGKLSNRLISKAKGVASVSTYFYHFGGLRRIYSMIGYSAEAGTFLKIDSRERSMQIRDRLISQIEALFSSEIVVFNKDHHLRPLLVAYGDTRIAVRICRQRCISTGTFRWRLLCGDAQQQDATLLCLLNRENKRIAKFHLIPRVLSISKEYSLRADDPLLHGSVGFRRLDTLLLVVNQVCRSSWPFAGRNVTLLKTT
jgi:DNA invertase Pin-like site-specific DNA recombinase